MGLPMGLMIFIPFDSTVDLEVVEDGLLVERTNIASEIRLVEILRSALDRRMEDRNRRQWANQSAPQSRQEALGAIFIPELDPEGGFS